MSCPEGPEGIRTSDGLAPRTAEQNQALREATRDRLLEAAMRLFSRHGYSATPIRKIAKEAGVAQGLLYSHYRGKEDLLKALFRRSMDDVRESFAAAASSGAVAGGAGTDSRSPLERLVASALVILKRNQEFWRLSYGVRMQEEVVEVPGSRSEGLDPRHPGLARGPFPRHRDGRSGGGIHGTADAAVQAALFFAAFDGICQHFVLDPENYPLEAVSRGLLERFAPPLPPAPPKGDIHGKRRRR